MTIQAIAIPAHIWEQDKPIFQSWLKSRSLGSMSVVQDYKRTLVRLHTAVAKPILAITEQDLDAFKQSMLDEGLSPVTVKKTMNVARSYWRHAHEKMTLFTVVLDPITKRYMARWLLLGNAEAQWYHERSLDGPASVEDAQRDVLRSVADAHYVEIERFAAFLELAREQPGRE